VVDIVFIGDELTAAGFRLAGVRVQTPAPAETTAVFAAALAEAGLVLITAEYAQALPVETLARAQRTIAPAVLVLGDIRGRLPAPDAGAALRRQLGMEA